MNLRILFSDLLDEFTSIVKDSPLDKLQRIKRIEIPVDYFQFYRSVSSVYSSKIEGEDIDFDSYYKHKFLNVKYKENYTARADDLFKAYEFIDDKKLNLDNLNLAHSILSKNLLPENHHGVIRSNPMFVLNSDDQIEYVAADPGIVKDELDKLFQDIDVLLNTDLNSFEVFYFAALIHLVFVKIHPYQDGNGRVARLIERWFLQSKIGEKAASVQLEKYYFTNLKSYYSNIKKLGLEYEHLDYNQCLDFLLMTVSSIGNDPDVI